MAVDVHTYLVRGLVTVEVHTYLVDVQSLRMSIVSYFGCRINAIDYAARKRVCSYS